MGFPTLGVWQRSECFSLEESRPETRASFLGVQNAVIASAFVLGPAVGGWLVGGGTSGGSADLKVQRKLIRKNVWVDVCGILWSSCSFVFIIFFISCESCYVASQKTTPKTIPPKLAKIFFKIPGEFGLRSIFFVVALGAATCALGYGFLPELRRPAGGAGGETAQQGLSSFRELIKAPEQQVGWGEHMRRLVKNM